MSQCHTPLSGQFCRGCPYIHALFLYQLRPLSRPFPRPFSDGVMVLVVGLVDKMKGLGELGESQCRLPTTVFKFLNKRLLQLSGKVTLLFLAFFKDTVLFSWNRKTYFCVFASIPSSEQKRILTLFVSGY